MRGNTRPHLSEALPSELLTRRLGGSVADGGPVARQLPL